MRKVEILYEDQFGDSTEFGPHKLVVQLVCDELGKSQGDFRNVLVANPKKGNSKVLAACKKDLGRLVKGGVGVIALYDSDRVGALVGLPRDACKTQLVAKLKADCEPVHRLGVVLLQENIETVLRAIAECDPAIVRPEDLSKAGKDRNSRDRILHKAAVVSARGTRDCVLEKVPSLGYLVQKIIRALSSPP